jgi:hypothetical protein
MTAVAITKAFAACSACYGARFRVPTDQDELRAMLETWMFLLNDVPDELGMAAFATHCRTSPHPPTPADVRALCEINNALPTTGEAWAEAIEAARRIGYQDGEVPAMSCPEVRDAARAAGWSGICFADSEMSLSTTRAHFFRIYDGFVTRTEREQKRVALEGAVPAGLLPRLKRVDAGSAIDKRREIPRRAREAR